MLKAIINLILLVFDFLVPMPGEGQMKCPNYLRSSWPSEAFAEYGFAKNFT
jgi:hypothetical protein